MSDKILIVDDAPAPRRNLGSLRSGGLVGGLPRSRLATFSLLATAAALMVDVPMPFDRMPSQWPKKPRDKTPEDLARIEAARLKRERKASKKSARTTTPNY